MFYLVGIKPSTSESETSIIINNVQRPNQADTPRPSMSFKTNHGGGQPKPHYFSQQLNRNFLSETEIQEIRTDDASEVVYGPAMSLSKQFESPLPTMCPPLVPPLLAWQQLNRGQPILNMPQISQYLEMTQHRHNNTMPISHSHIFNKPNKPKKQSDAKRPSTSSTLETKGNSLHKPFQRSIVDGQCDSAKLMQDHGIRIPGSLTIYPMPNEENEQSSNRLVYNMKNANVQNSIEIVKITDESGGNETNFKFPSPSSSSPSPSSSSTSSFTSSASLGVDKSWQTNKNATTTTTTNNQTKQITNQQNNQIDSTSKATTSSLLDSSFQAKFIASFQTSLKNAKTSSQSKPQSNRPALTMDEFTRCQEAQKRKQQQQIDDKLAKVPKLQQTVQQQRSLPTTQRPVPDLVIPKDERKVTVSNSSSSSSSNSGGGGTSTSNQQAQKSSSNTNQLANNKSTQDRQSPTVSSNPLSTEQQQAAALTLSVAQAKVQSVANDISKSQHLPLQTSTTPIWAKHCSPHHQASHQALLDCLTSTVKKNSGTFAD